MLIEYEDLVSQLQQFRLEVIKALAAIDIEVDALQAAVVKSKPLLAEDLKRLRAASRSRLSKFEEFHGHKLPLLHEKR